MLAPYRFVWSARSRPWSRILQHWAPLLARLLLLLDGDARLAEPPLCRRPLPDASPRWCRALKPLVVVVVRARPVRWRSAPSGEMPGVVGTVACSAATRRGRWWARWRNGLHGASVGRVCWGRRCLARGSQAGQDGDSLKLENGDARYKIPRLIYPRHVATSCTRGPNYYNRSPSPQTA